MTPNQGALLWESLKDLSFQVDRIHRCETYFRCELGAAKGSRCGSYLVVHAPFALDFAKAYTPTELQDYPIWVNGYKLPKARLEGAKVLKRKRGLALIGYVA